jgi:hypothetical protein
MLRRLQAAKPPPAVSEADLLRLHDALAKQDAWTAKAVQVGAAPSQLKLHAPTACYRIWDTRATAVSRQTRAWNSPLASCVTCWLAA